MSAHEIRYRELASMEASLNYVAASPERLRTYAFDPPAGTPQSNVVFEPHRVRIFDVRPVAPELDREGFALVKKATSVQDFSDKDAVRNVYYPEAEALLLDHTGAERVVFSITRSAGGLRELSTGLRGCPASPLFAFITITLKSQARSVSGTSSALKRKASFKSALPLSMSGGRFKAPFVTRRWRCAMPGAQIRTTLWPRTSSIATASARLTR